MQQIKIPEQLLQKTNRNKYYEESKESKSRWVDIRNEVCNPHNRNYQFQLFAQKLTDRNTSTKK